MWQLVKVKMADDCQEDKNYLPDLNNELAGRTDSVTTQSF